MFWRPTHLQRSKNSARLTPAGSQWGNYLKSTIILVAFANECGLPSYGVFSSCVVTFARYYEITLICRCIVHHRFAMRISSKFTVRVAETSVKTNVKREISGEYPVVYFREVASWSENVRNAEHNYRDLWGAVNKAFRDIFLRKAVSHFIF